MAMRTPLRTMRGFTMVELLITMALIAVLLALGVPAFTSFVQDSRMVSTTNDLVADLQAARSEAIKRNNPVTLCRSTNGATCAGGAQWESGWIVFDDPNGNVTVDGAEPILRVYNGTAGTMTVRVTAGNVVGSVSFDGDGYPRTPANVTQTATWSVCDERGVVLGEEAARGVQLGASGRIRTTRDAGIIGSCT